MNIGTAFLKGHREYRRFRKGRNARASTTFAVLFLFLVLVCGISLPVNAQSRRYTITGRVLDKFSPKSEVRLVVGPDDSVTWKGSDLLVENSSPEVDGSFELIETGERGQVRTLYVIAGKFDGLDLLAPPYLGPGLSKRFRGLRVELGDMQRIDLGDINVQQWYASVTLHVLNDGRRLTKQEWEGIFCNVENDHGVVLSGKTLGSVVRSDEIDLATSTLRLSLPEGRWRISFQAYNNSTRQILSQIIGTSDYFTVRRDITLNLRVNLELL